ncbi:MAG: hypothetical protein LBB72_07195 [Spirochaetaceae bacterium]|jgi:parallel beta-helix repeat protein|nr:hypothetical protein [Spirochaetaceae bacterium]
MKIRNYLFTALCFAVFCLGACSNLGESDSQGSININLGNPGARYAVNETGMIYTITLASPGKGTITKTTGESSVTIAVPEGIWAIKVHAEGKRVTGDEKKIETVMVTAGKPASAKIEMKVTGTRVSSWSELEEDFIEFNNANGKLKDLDNIEIVAKNLDASSSANILLNRANKAITLWAKDNVTIKRKDDKGINVTVFTITNGTLILDGTKGTITIKGNGKNSDCGRALINVETNGILEMRDGTTLTDNHTTNYGGGVYVRDNGKFYMYGGTISGNKADNNGGGVYVRDSGIFTKTGGIIYGTNGGDDGNVAPEGNGAAVYFSSSKKSETTLGKTDNWSNLN